MRRTKASREADDARMRRKFAHYAPPIRIQEPIVIEVIEIAQPTIIDEPVLVEEPEPIVEPPRPSRKQI